MSRRRLLILAKLKESGEDTLPKLDKPSIVIEYDDLYIMNPDTNGDLSVDYYITVYDPGTMRDEETRLVDNGDSVYFDEANGQFVISISKYFPQTGTTTTYSVRAKLKSAGFADSDYTESVPVTRYPDNSGSTVEITQTNSSSSNCNLYVKINNEYNIFHREGSSYTNRGIHKMQFYFEHPELTGVKRAVLFSGGDETALSITVNNGRTNTINLVTSPESNYYYEFEFVFNESNI